MYGFIGFIIRRTSVLPMMTSDFFMQQDFAKEHNIDEDEFIKKVEIWHENR